MPRRLLASVPLLACLLMVGCFGGVEKGKNKDKDVPVPTREPQKAELPENPVMKKAPAESKKGEAKEAEKPPEKPQDKPAEKPGK